MDEEILISSRRVEPPPVFNPQARWQARTGLIRGSTDFSLADLDLMSRGLFPLRGAATEAQFQQSFQGIRDVEAQLEMSRLVTEFDAALGSTSRKGKQARTEILQRVHDLAKGIVATDPDGARAINLVIGMMREEQTNPKMRGRPSELVAGLGSQPVELTPPAEAVEVFGAEPSPGPAGRAARRQAEDQEEELSQGVDGLDKKIQSLEKEIRQAGARATQEQRQRLEEMQRYRQDLDEYLGAQDELRENRARMERLEADLERTSGDEFRNIVIKSVNYGFFGWDEVGRDGERVHHEGIKEAVQKVLVRYERLGARVTGIPLTTLALESVPEAVEKEIVKYEGMLSGAERLGETQRAERLREELAEIKRFMPEVEGRIALLNFRFAWEGKGGKGGVGADIGEALRGKADFPPAKLWGLLLVPEIREAFRSQKFVDVYGIPAGQELKLQYQVLGRWLRRITGLASYVDCVSSKSVLEGGWGPVVAWIQPPPDYPVKEDNALKKWAFLVWSIGPKAEGPYTLSTQLLLDYDPELLLETKALQAEGEAITDPETKVRIKRELQEKVEEFHQTVRDWSRTLTIPSVLHIPHLAPFYFDNFAELPEAVQIEMLRKQATVQNGREGVFIRRLQDEIAVLENKRRGGDLKPTEAERLEALVAERAEIRTLIRQLGRYQGLEEVPTKLRKNTLELIYFNLPRWVIARNEFTGAQEASQPAIDVDSIDFARLSWKYFDREALTIFYDNNNDVQTTKMQLRDRTTEMGAPTLEIVYKLLGGEKKIYDELSRGPYGVYLEHVAHLVDFPSRMELLALRRQRRYSGYELMEKVCQLEDTGASRGEFHTFEFEPCEFEPSVAWNNLYMMGPDQIPRWQLLRLVVQDTAHIMPTYDEKTGQLITIQPNPDGQRELWEEAVLNDIEVTWEQFLAWLRVGKAKDGGIQNSRYQEEWSAAQLTYENLPADVKWRLNFVFNFEQFDIRHRRDVRKIIDFLIDAWAAKRVEPKPIESILPTRVKIRPTLIGRLIEGNRPYGEMFDSGALDIMKKERKMLLARAMGGPGVRWAPIHHGFNNVGVQIWQGTGTLDSFIEGTFHTRPKDPDGDPPLVCHDDPARVMYAFLAARSATYQHLGAERMGENWEKDRVWARVISPGSLGRVEIKGEWRDGYIREFRSAFELADGEERAWEEWCGANDEKHTRDWQTKKGRTGVVDFQAVGVPEDPFATGYKAVGRMMVAARAPWYLALAWPADAVKKFSEFKYEAMAAFVAFQAADRLSLPLLTAILGSTRILGFDAAALAFGSKLITPWIAGMLMNDPGDLQAGLRNAFSNNLGLPKEREKRRSYGVMTGQSHLRKVVMPIWDDFYDDPDLIRAVGKQYWQVLRASPHLRCYAQSWTSAPYEFVNPVRYQFLKHLEGTADYADYYPDWVASAPYYWTRRDLLTTFGYAAAVLGGLGYALTHPGRLAGLVTEDVKKIEARKLNVDTAQWVDVLGDPKVFDRLVATYKYIGAQYPERTGGINNVANWSNPKAVDEWTSSPLEDFAEPFYNVWTLAPTVGGRKELADGVKGLKFGPFLRDNLLSKLDAVETAVREVDPSGNLTQDQFEQLMIDEFEFTPNQIELARIMNATWRDREAAIVRQKYGQDLERALAGYR